MQIVVGEANYGGPALPQPGMPAGERERDAVAPIVAALVDTGVPEDQIDVIVGPSIAELGTYFGPAMALIRVAVDDPEQEQLSELVNTATTAAAEERLVIGRTSAVFGIDGCSELEREARELAVEDAYQQADIMAELLGVSRGDILGASDVASDSQAAFSAYGPVLSVNECGAWVIALSPYAVSALPPFDPTAEPEVTAYAVPQLTFDLLENAGATPAT